MNLRKKIVRLGMDMGKNMFHLVGVDEAGLAAVKKQLPREQVLAYFANRPPCRVAMAACAGSSWSG